MKRFLITIVLKDLSSCSYARFGYSLADVESMERALHRTAASLTVELNV